MKVAFRGLVMTAFRGLVSCHVDADFCGCEWLVFMGAVMLGVVVVGYLGYAYDTIVSKINIGPSEEDSGLAETLTGKAYYTPSEVDDLRNTIVQAGAAGGYEAYHAAEARGATSSEARLTAAIAATKLGSSSAPSFVSQTSARDL